MTIWTNGGAVVINDAGTAVIDCETCPCDDDGIQTDCCENTVPAMVTANITVLDCSCASSANVTLTHRGDEDIDGSTAPTWRGSAAFGDCDRDIEIAIQCTGANSWVVYWRFDDNCNNCNNPGAGTLWCGFVPFMMEECDPFELSGHSTITLNEDCCGMGDEPELVITVVE